MLCQVSAVGFINRSVELIQWRKWTNHRRHDHPVFCLIQWISPVYNDVYKHFLNDQSWCLGMRFEIFSQHPYCKLPFVPLFGSSVSPTVLDLIGLFLPTCFPSKLPLLGHTWRTTACMLCTTEEMLKWLPSILRMAMLSGCVLGLKPPGPRSWANKAEFCCTQWPC